MLRLPLRSRTTASVTAFSFSAAQTALFALYPFLAERLGIGVGSVIASFSLGSFLYLFGSPFWSRKSDLWGRVRVLRVGAGGLVLSFALLAFLVTASAPSPALGLALLVLSRAIYGVFASSIPPVAQSLQADADSGKDEISDSRAAMFRHSISLSAGRVFALLLLVFSPFSIAASLSMILALLATTTLALGLVPVEAANGADPAKLGKTEHEISYASEDSPRGFSLPSFAGLSGLKGVLAIAFLFTLFIEGLNSSFAATLQRSLELDTVSTSRFAAQLLLGVSVGVLVVQALAKRISSLSGVTGFGLGLSALFAGAVSFSQADSITAYWLSILFLSIGIGILPPLYLTLIKSAPGPLSYASRAGWIASTHTLGYSSGGFLAAAGLSFGIPLGYVLAASTLAMAAAFFAVVRSHALSQARARSASEASA